MREGRSTPSSCGVGEEYSRVSWMERKTNISIIENIKPELTLESRVAKATFDTWCEQEGWKMTQSCMC